VRAAAAAALAAALATTLTACGSSGSPPAPEAYAAQVARACPGAAAGAQALGGAGGSPQQIIARVKGAERTATRAAKALDHVQAPAKLVEDQDAVVRSLLAQAIRLRLVREQIAHGSPAGVVIDAARAGLDDGDRQASNRLAAIGVKDCRGR
jgi:hypothetical protein